MEKTNNHPNWLVPLEIARKLTEIGMSNPEILVCNDNYYGWYKGDQMYDRDRDGDTYTAFEVYEWGKSNLEPTYTWEQAFEWFREKGLIGVIDYFFDILRDKPLYKYEIKNIIGQVIFINKEVIETYNEAIGLLINQLIEIYKIQRYKK